MLLLIYRFNSKINYSKLADKCFFLGIFLLASAPGPASILLFYSLINSSYRNRDYFLKDNSNIQLLLVSLLMIISCSYRYFINKGDILIGFNSQLDWLGILNWIPLFWCFWGFQYYLKTTQAKQRFSFCFIAGTLPVVVSGLGQYFFQWHGPFKFLNGFIIWFQKPINNYDGLSGLFSNANYTGLWLSLVLPFCLINYLIKSKRKIEILFINLFTLSIFISAFLTYSKNAWLGLLISFPLIFGLKILFILLPILLLCIFLILTATSQIFAGSLQLFVRDLLPEYIWKYKFKDIGFDFLIASPRIRVWVESYKLICSNPFIGYGASSFPILYQLSNGEWISHTHNIIFEFAINYGIPGAILLSYLVFNLIYKSFVKIFKSNNHFIIEKAWFTSTLILILSQMFDVQYYDLRISILGWILLAGLKTIVSPNQMKSMKI